MTRQHVVEKLQRAWWVIGVIAALGGALGVRVLLPAQEIAAYRAHDLLQDTILAQTKEALRAHAEDEARKIEKVQTQVDRLIAGMCAKERDRMARVAFGCP